MLGINLKPIKESLAKINNILDERLNGKLDNHTAHESMNYAAITGKLNSDNILNYTYEDLSELGELISKVQKMAEFYQTRDDSILCKYLKDESFIGRKLSQKDISDIVANRNENSKEYRAKVYSYIFELDIPGCINVLKNYTTKTFKKKESPTKLTKNGINNLSEIMFCGLSPEEIKILFNLSNDEAERFRKTMYVEPDDFYKNIPFDYTLFYNSFISASAKTNKLLQDRLAGNMSHADLIFPSMNYVSAQDELVHETDFDMVGKMAGEITSKILVFKGLVKNMSLENLADNIKKIIAKDHAWTEQELSSIVASGQTKEEYIKTLKSAIRKGNEADLILLRNQVVANICDIDATSANFIYDLFIEKKALEDCENYEDSHAEKEFTEILYILGIMRTNIKTDCIEHISFLDAETSEAIRKLYRTRIVETN